MIRHVNYKSIRVEGFQSFGSYAVFSFDAAGIHLIKGANGVGKSTLFNAILWCEFGHNLKKNIETWEDRRPVDYKGTRVVLTRQVGEYQYLIARHKSYKGKTFGLTGGDKLMIFRKSADDTSAWTAEHMLHDDQHKSQMQDAIIEQLGIDLKTYMNSIFFGQRLSGLIGVSNTEKRDLFEKLFDVDFVAAAREKAKGIVDENERNISTKQNEVSRVKMDLERTISDLEATKIAITNFKAEKQAEIDSKHKDLENVQTSLKTNIKALNQAKEDLKQIDNSDFDELSNTVTVLQRSLRDAKQELSQCLDILSDWEDTENSAELKKARFEEDLSNVDESCPVCEAPLKPEKIQAAKAKITKLISTEQQVIDKAKAEFKKVQKVQKVWEKKVEDVQAKLQTKQTQLAELDVERQERSKLLSNITTLETRVEWQIERQDELKKEIAKLNLKEYTPPVLPAVLEDRITQNEKFIQEAEVQISKMQKQVDNYGWWVKVGFGSSGLKAYVFNAMLTQLNLYAAEYAARLGFGVEFSVDMTKASKPFQTLVYQNDEVRDYLDLSGGQKQRVDMVVAFAMHDMVSYKTRINILVMDEVFEGLDNDGVETAFDLIRRKAENHAVYLITHNDIIDSLQSKTITIESDELGNSYIS